MQNQNSDRGKPNMTVDFEMLEEAKTNSRIARLFRMQWHLDKSDTGKVFCDEAECHDRLKNGLLPPVLTAAQFARISSGQAYGEFDADPDPGLTIQATRAYVGSAGSDPYQTHPQYREYAALSPEVKEALRNDFSCYLEVKKRGRLDAIIDAVHEQLARDARRASTAERKRAYERELAEDCNSPRYQEIAARFKGNRNYPGLK